MSCTSESATARALEDWLAAAIEPTDELADELEADLAAGRERFGRDEILFRSRTATIERVTDDARGPFPGEDPPP